MLPPLALIILVSHLVHVHFVFHALLIFLIYLACTPINPSVNIHDAEAMPQGHPQC